MEQFVFGENFLGGQWRFLLNMVFLDLTSSSFLLFCVKPAFPASQFESNTSLFDKIIEQLFHKLIREQKLAYYIRKQVKANI
jgi:hypothetical protein